MPSGIDATVNRGLSSHFVAHLPGPRWLKTLLGCVVFAMAAVRWWTLIVLQLKRRRPRVGAPNLLEGNKNPCTFSSQDVEFLAKQPQVNPYDLLGIGKSASASEVQQLPTHNFATLPSIFLWWRQWRWWRNQESVAKMLDFRLARLIEISACNGIQIKIPGQELSFMKLDEFCILDLAWGVVRNVRTRCPRLPRPLCFVGAWKLRKQ